MNKNLLKNYQLTASIHTLSVKSKGIVEGKVPEIAEAIKRKTTHHDNGLVTTLSTINPNKLAGDCFRFSDFLYALENILTLSDIQTYDLIRVDLRLDNYDPEHYQTFQKLNRYLLSALAVTYKVKNSYKTENLFSKRQLSIAIKNDYFEIENYDRNAKSNLTENHQELAMSRLEERTLAREWRKRYSSANNPNEENMRILVAEFTDGWFNRWEKALKNINLVHKAYNDELEQIYKSGKSAYPCKFRNLTDFLIQYQECIFCTKQMIDLLSRFPEIKNPSERAKNHKKRYGIEYFSQKDIRIAVEEIKRATLAFFYD